MVRLLRFTGWLSLLLLFSCDFFLQTPFPVELNLLDSYLDLSEDVIEDDMNSYYTLHTLDDYLILTVDNSWAYIVDTNSMQFISKQEGNYNNFFVQDAVGDFHIGSTVFDSGMNLLSTAFSTIDLYKYGFYYNGINYTVFFNPGSRELLVETYDNVWANTGNDYLLNSGMDYLEELRLAVLDNSGGSPETDYLVLCFRTGNNGLYEAVRIPFSLFYPEGTSFMNGNFPYPFEQEKFSLPNVESDYLYYTRDGFVVKTDNRFRLYTGDSYTQFDSRQDNESMTIAYSQAGKYFYRFDNLSHKLYKMNVWW